MIIQKLSQLQGDVLREVMNMGMAHAMNAIAQLIDRKIMISVPNVSLIPLKEVPGKIAKEKGVEQIIAGLYFRILGDLHGNVMLILPMESAHQLSAMLIDKPAQNGIMLKSDRSGAEPAPTEEIEEIVMGRSALMEVGNILTNSYLNALSSLMDFTLFPSIPHYAEDMLGAVLDYVLIEISKSSDNALFMETQFSADEISLSGDFVIFPEPASLEKIMKKVGLE